ncbi:hypothetical protein M501DRAFT_1008897 [Patellaria atrata CBS 101060]|uniref:PHD-type domain-containing protein n=1 Tax=Patellaria atrata CBS 101060 TaxID=1346257 RepID=A0A9P4VJ96_9PEZI|nr:hypothetical protein M501DRAFT_1008897 [Patellaria atrata CBS 101060]
MPDITPQPASHPDAQATVTDFLDYTDYFPSDLTRSLTLIYKLDRLYLETTDEIHALTKIYGALPTLPPNERPDPKLLRKRISAAIDRANHLRESSYAEANRINDEAARYGTRLISIKKKLQALPKPPSRDPTPAPVSPQVLRPRKSTEIDHTPRITLRMDGARQAATGRSRDRRRITPGDVVPMEVDVPEDEGGSESWDDEIDVEQGKNSENVQPQKTEKVSKNKVPRAPRIRPPGVMGTNVHSTVAGISTSNALALLPKPPENPIPGSLHAPWHRLTEYEMAVLRKMMKKNAVWSPSDTMIRRELAEKGRGRENYERAKERARLTGEPFVDEDPIDPNKKVLAPGETSFQPLGKDEIPAPSASSTSSSELDDPEDISSPSAPSKLASPALKAARSPSLQLKEEMAEEPSPTETPLPEHEQEATEEDTVMAEDTKTPPTLPITTIEEPTPTPIPRKTPTPGPHTRSTPAPVVTRPPSRRAAAAATKAMSAEPPAAKRESRELRDLRRMSVVETSLSTLPGVGLRSSTRRRPVPGVVTEQEGGKGKVSVGKRKNAPKKRGGGRGKGADGKGEEREEDGEEVDPDEPRYCVCGEVSFGTMIACENDKCEKEWFHLSCVGLTEIPPRRSLWYCPDCRKNLHVDQSGHPSGAASAPVETGRRRRGSR